MDPAYLVWIPPLAPGETEILEAIKEDHHYEEIPDRIGGEAGSRIAPDTEGASLTPAEYRKMKSYRLEDQSSLKDSEIYPRRIDSGESRLHDEIITEYRARLHEGILPVHRILEESKISVNEEPHNPPIDIIPNRLFREIEQQDSKEILDVKFSPKTNRDRLLDEQERCRSVNTSRSNRLGDDERRQTPAAVRSRLQEYVENNTKSNYMSPETARSSTSELFKINQNRRKNSNDATKPRRHSTRDNDRDFCESKDEFILPKPKTPLVHHRYKEIADFNSVIESKKITGIESIPMREFARSRNDSPARVHRTNEMIKNKLPEKEIQSPDYGVEADIREISRDSFYDFIGEDEDGFKFADDDEDDYIDNKITA